VTHPLGLVLVAFVVTAVPAYLLTKVIEQHLESLTSWAHRCSWEACHVAG